MNLQEQLSEAENLAKELESLKAIPDLLHRHDACMYRLFMLAHQVGVPENVASQNKFEPRMVEAAAFLTDVIADHLNTKIQVENLKKERGD
jgi:hypothetical protein